ncbi:Membrane protein involved in the export of O-antigen and teichoic acid [Microbacterium sp. LKL04]|uniref:lipopolysaccharide biosynthesis protein n=1 Tax=Microbacterium sp. LKL04 TaxID=912630 RepID=UPI000875C43D|nr:oligosaccharide flippase family protein [Microbacterium sp. LKL04]SCY47049.1 Membrane protein involved in the export of O-antigen and teichoic acid [Microbacterium sp. LKL04]
MRRGFVVRIAAVGLAAIVQAVSLLVIARGAGATLFGVFSIAFSIYILCSAVTGLGLNNYALRLNYASRKAPDVLRSMIAWRTIAILVLLVLIACAGVISEKSLAGTGPFIWLAGAAGASEQVSDLTQGILSGRREVLKAAIFLVAQRLFALAGVIVGLLTTDVALWAGLGFVGSSVLAAAPWLRYIGRPHRMRLTFKGASAYWGATVTSSASQLEPTIVGLFGNAATAGFYSLGVRLAGPVNLVTNAVVTIAVPQMSASDTATKRSIYKKMRKFAIASAGAAVVIATPAAWVVEHALGPGFSGSAPFVAALVIAAAVSGISRTAQAFLYSIDRARPAALAIGTGTCVTLATLAISGWVSPVGLPLAPILGQLITMVAILRAAHKT